MISLDPSVQQFAARFGSHYRYTTQDPLYETIQPYQSDHTLREKGLLSGTLVANPNGWVSVDTIAPGDMVLTFDNGMQRVAAKHHVTLERGAIPLNKAFTMFVPKGALGNRKDMRVLPMQELIVESDRAETLFGDPFVLMPAYLLEGYRGIHKQSFDDDLQVFVLLFETEQIVHTNGGLLALGQMLAIALSDAPHQLHADAAYPRLTQNEMMLVAEWRNDAPTAYPAFAAQSIEETWADLNTKLKL